MFRQGLAGVLASYEGMEVVAEVPNDAEALELARRLSNYQIASSLSLAEATVKRHLANVYNKMGVSSRGEASREALLRDWITIEEVTRSDPPFA
jgi:DNA-binding NarL/FixJ family response regulator